MRKFVAVSAVAFYALIGLGLSVLQISISDTGSNSAMYYPGGDYYYPGVPPPTFTNPPERSVSWVVYLPLATTLVLGLACVTAVAACQDDNKRIDTLSGNLLGTMFLAIVGWAVYLWLSATTGSLVYYDMFWVLGWLFALALGVLAGISASEISQAKTVTETRKDEKPVTRKNVRRIVREELAKTRKRKS